jgi:hypothetical protein
MMDVPSRSASRCARDSAPPGLPKGDATSPIQANFFQGTFPNAGPAEKSELSDPLEQEYQEQDGKNGKPAGQ